MIKHNNFRVFGRDSISVIMDEISEMANKIQSLYDYNNGSQGSKDPVFDRKLAEIAKNLSKVSEVSYKLGVEILK